MHRLVGGLSIANQQIARAGFMTPALSASGLAVAPGQPLYTRGASLNPEALELITRMERGEVTDLSSVLVQLGAGLGELVRGVSSGLTAFPVRENLESEARVLVPTDTPVRNMLARQVGAGTGSNWRQITSLGGGWGTTPTQPGGGSRTRLFFSESVTGSQAPAEFTTTYVNRSANYKLFGAFGSVTGFAMAAGANFQNQLSREKTNALTNLMLNEEFALICGVASGNDMYGIASTAAPWGDGTNALAYDGLWASISTTNGTPTAHIQSSVGALELSHLDSQLTRLWEQGGREQYMVMASQEIQSMSHLAEANGSIIRVTATNAEGILGFHVVGYRHPVTGQIVPILPSRFLLAGEIIFGSKYLPDGSPAADVDVLPQVQLPELAPNENVMGYVAQELAPTIAAPQVYPFIVTVYSVFRMKGATVFGKSSGVTAV